MPRDVPGQQTFAGKTVGNRKPKSKQPVPPGPPRPVRRVIKWVNRGGSLREQLCGFVYVDDGSPVPKNEWPKG